MEKGLKRKKGTENQNPTDIGYFALKKEDLQTYDNHRFEPGYLAVRCNRFGNWRMGIKKKIFRIPFTILYNLAHSLILNFWGIDLPYTVKLGRRVRIWHHGNIIIAGAISIGDDVHMRHNTTMGLVRKEDAEKEVRGPIIGNRVDIGCGACILGPVTVGDDTVIGANSVVVRSYPAGATLFGVPARQVKVEM